MRNKQQFNKKPAAAKKESQIIGYFYVNRTADGRESIRVAIADGTTLFLNYSKEAEDRGVVVLGQGGKAFDLKGAEVRVKIDVKAKEEKAKGEDDLF